MSTDSSSLPKPSEQTLLEEYKQAQQSAEHHDKLLWTVLSLVLAGMAALFGFVLKIFDLTKKDWHVSFGAFVGLVLCYLSYFFINSFGRYRNQKYDRCKSIEAQLGMRAHTDTPKQSQRRTVIAVLVLFAVMWLFLLVWAVHQ